MERGCGLAEEQAWLHLAAYPLILVLSPYLAATAHLGVLATVGDTVQNVKDYSKSRSWFLEFVLKCVFVG